MMNAIKRFFSNVYVQIVSIVLLIAMLAGAAAVLLPATQKAVDDAKCLHSRSALLNTNIDDNGDTVYRFRCQDCRALFYETPSTSQFVLHKPTIVDGVVTMVTPWEIGAYYDDDYRLFTKKANDNWYTNGTLWNDATGVRVSDTYVSMTSSSFGDAAITYIAQEDGYVHPYFVDIFTNSVRRNCEYAIYLNGESVAPADGNFVYQSSSTSTENLTADWNEKLADTWIKVKKGDKVSFVVVFTGTESTEFILQPAVEFMIHNPNR